MHAQNQHSRTLQLFIANVPNIKPTGAFAQTCFNRHSRTFANILIPLLKAFIIVSLTNQLANNIQVLQGTQQEILLIHIQFLFKDLMIPFLSCGKLHIWEDKQSRRVSLLRGSLLSTKALTGNWASCVLCFSTEKLQAFNTEDSFSYLTEFISCKFSGA